ncbi:DUF563 domain-containing protein [Cephalotus follicularis]|uniref:DUF563 domain-containing protein n=1 Tax=Cephalotus follicularis TaxID=3775 RepID=A0A1Q3B002_CEPFO|nr:DUF563 domain-containing protein [Cephalotus follicularis]
MAVILAPLINVNLSNLIESYIGQLLKIIVLVAEEERLKQNATRKKKPLVSHEARQIRCDYSHKKYDLCSINGPTVLDPTTSTFYTANSTSQAPPFHVLKIRPYPRKWETSIMATIKELTLTSGPPPPSSTCQVQHNAPALVFSAGGYTGNFFHDFNDGFIPLYITVSSIYPNQDFVLVISQASDWWVHKYAEVLRAFSKHHPIVNLDKDTATHCFTSATIGLMSHGFMTIDSKLIPSSKTLSHFRAFLGKAYDQGQTHHPDSESRPRLVLASRTGDVGRVILNQAELKWVAQDVGFDVVVFEPRSSDSLREAYALINSSHVMVGVHGAALTHSLFLRPGSVLVQVVPLGTQWVAEVCFANPAKDLGLVYMEYKIGAEESSLVGKYDKNDVVIKDPVAFQGNYWSTAVMSIYLREQNVKLNLDRFREYLKKAYKEAKKLMENEG